MLWVAATQLLLSMVVLYAETVECTNSAESVWNITYLVCRKAGE